ncbi:unnamed protein product [Closterium sp. Naga37s-1]|nr:unnamed protein product [Closterium sp. Naga37s-1]
MSLAVLCGPLVSVPPLLLSVPLLPPTPSLCCTLYFLPSHSYDSCLCHRFYLSASTTVFYLLVLDTSHPPSFPLFPHPPALLFLPHFFPFSHHLDPLICPLILPPPPSPSTPFRLPPLSRRSLELSREAASFLLRTLQADPLCIPALVPLVQVSFFLPPPPPHSACLLSLAAPLLSRKVASFLLHTLQADPLCIPALVPLVQVSSSYVPFSPPTLPRRTPPPSSSRGTCFESSLRGSSIRTLQADPLCIPSLVPLVQVSFSLNPIPLLLHPTPFRLPPLSRCSLELFQESASFLLRTLQADPLCIPALVPLVHLHASRADMPQLYPISCLALIPSSPFFLPTPFPALQIRGPRGVGVALDILHRSCLPALSLISHCLSPHSLAADSRIRPFLSDTDSCGPGHQRSESGSGHSAPLVPACCCTLHPSIQVLRLMPSCAHAMRGVLSLGLQGTCGPSLRMAILALHLNALATTRESLPACLVGWAGWEGWRESLPRSHSFSHPRPRPIPLCAGTCGRLSPHGHSSTACGRACCHQQHQSPCSRLPDGGCYNHTRSLTPLPPPPYTGTCGPSLLMSTLAVHLDALGATSSSALAAWWGLAGSMKAVWLSAFAGAAGRGAAVGAAVVGERDGGRRGEGAARKEAAAKEARARKVVLQVWWERREWWKAVQFGIGHVKRQLRLIDRLQGG